ncbi:single-stranded DNA-binding protein [Diaminobutyricibacter sp. McL0608]|uniref:single-stranded DNA-binding protein n=1 Tax=Leifsonia sp. McL0608 TaxID=3143537 RepID=UPI0031F2EE55
MNDSLSTRGVVATVPNHIVTSEGLPITSFRLASSQRKFNRSTQTWENGDTNWFTVTAFRQLATNIAACVSKGDRIVVSGRLSVRDWESGDRSGTVVEVDADAVGHDLTWGTATFSRTVKRSGPAEGQPPAEAAEDGGQSAWGEADKPAPAGGLLSASPEAGEESATGELSTRERAIDDADTDSDSDPDSESEADAGTVPTGGAL